MAVNFGKKNQGNAGQSSASLPSFMKKGAAAKQAMEDEQKRQEERANQIWRFWMAKDAETKITFLDGNLDADGLLDCPMWYEHNLQLAGKWGNFYTCVKEEEPCPICEKAGDSYLAAGFTIIDHTAYKSKRSGKIIKDSIKLFIAKQDTLKMLQKLAVKRNGLAGCTFDVSRTGENSANVGDMFDYTEKHTLEELQQMYGSTKKGEEKLILPVDFSKAISYHSAEELRKMGFGDAPIGSGDQYKGNL